jgi:hypothetical protein
MNEAAKTRRTCQAHSAPDPTDFFVLGTDLQNLNHGEAADAFGGCRRIAWPLHAECEE